MHSEADLSKLLHGLWCLPCGDDSRRLGTATDLIVGLIGYRARFPRF